MSKELWAQVDRYFSDALIPSDADLAAASEATVAAGLPPIAVSEVQGKLLHLLARMHQSRSILEVGTLGGFSTIWLARALPPDGRLVTLELDPKHAQVATANIARAGLAKVVEVRLGAAADSLAQLVKEGGGPFDFIFIDADKKSIPEYFSRALELSRPGTVIIVDNVVRNGAVIEAESSDPDIQGVRRFTEMVKKEPRVSGTAVQTVGAKGYDGFALLLVN